MLSDEADVAGGVSGIPETVLDACLFVFFPLYSFAGWTVYHPTSERLTYKSSSKPRARFLSGPVSVSICLYLFFVFYHLLALGFSPPLPVFITFHTFCRMPPLPTAATCSTPSAEPCPHPPSRPQNGQRMTRLTPGARSMCSGSPTPALGTRPPRPPKRAAFFSSPVCLILYFLHWT